MSFRAWTYEKEVQFGSPIQDAVEKSIRNCDVVIALLSASGVRSKWVARELALAKALQASRRRGTPRIVGFSTGRPALGTRLAMLFNGNTNAPWRVPLRNFHTGLPTGDVMDFADNRFLSMDMPHADKFEFFAEQMTPKVQFFGERPGDSDDLPEGWEACYEELFPVADERDDPEDIKIWMEREAMRGPDTPWQTLLTTMCVFDEVVGLGYFSFHKPSGWVFGNYFGIRRPWRHYYYANTYLEAIRNELLRRLPDAKGILFEVEPFNVRDLDTVEHKLKAGIALLEPGERELIRSLRRLNLYEQYGARALVTPRNLPVHYRQPAMTDRRAADVEDTEADFRDLHPQEVELILLFYPIGANALTSSSPVDAFAFLYDEFFLEAYGWIPGYGTYLSTLRKEIESKMPTGSRWGHAFPRRARSIIDLAKRLRIEIDL